MNAGFSSLFRTSVQPLSSFLRDSVLPSSASTLPSVQAPTFVGFLTFLYCSLSLSNFDNSLSSIFILRFTLFSFVNSYAFSYYLSFLLPDEASGPNGVNSPASCSTDCLLFFSIRRYFSSYMKAGISSLFRTAVQP